MVSISNKHVYGAYATVNSNSSKKISERSDVRDRLTIIGFVATGMLILLLFLVSLLLEGSARDFLIEEGGLIELSSAFGHFLCVAIILYKGGLSYLKQYHYVVLLIIFFMLRELDFHLKFTTMGIFKTRFYISNSVLLVEKIVGAMVILLLLYLIFKMVHRHSREFLLGLKNYSVVSIGIFMAIVLIVVSQLVDGIGRKLRAFDVEISNQIKYAFKCNGRNIRVRLGDNSNPYRDCQF